MSAPPARGFDGLLETCLYHDTARAAEIERFYGELLGLPMVASWRDGRAFRAGAGVLLLFDRELLAERPESKLAHGSSGPGHACLLATGENAYEDWMRRLRDHDVEILDEHVWSEQRRSFYFSDPAGNLLEVAEADIWPSPF